MIYGSVCSGIEAATVAWEPLGWKAAWFAEIMKFPSRLLNHYYPHVPNLGDMTKLSENEKYIKSIIDVLVGGTPCQDFSLAGLRSGLVGERGGLSIEFCRILLQKRPTWFIWENVPGVFSSNNGSDFAAILSGFRECGYSCAYRVLDGIHFGIPQRRRRVFVVGYLGNDWRPPAAVLFERGSLQFDFTTGEEKAKKITERLANGFATYGIKSTAIGRSPDNGGNGLGITEEESGTLTTIDRHAVSYAFNENTICRPTDRANPKAEQCPTLTENGRTCIYTPPFVFDKQHITSPINNSNPKPEECHTLTTRGAAIMYSPVVRYLTPLEWERLQGFPDGYTNISGASDNMRYSALGNSMPVPVMRWLAERIEIVSKFLK